MKNTIQELRDIKGVKNVKKQSGPVLKINLFSRKIKGSEVEEIKGDLRKISQSIKNTLDEAKTTDEFNGWEWIVKPEKKYSETRLGRSRVSDRKAKGHEPAYYRVSIETGDQK